MGLVLRDLWDHEGYVAHRLPDGTFATYATDLTGRAVAYQPACSCGWVGASEHPPNDDGQQAALDAWYRDHTEPMVRHTVPSYLRESIDQLKEALSDLTPDRPLAVLTVVRELRSYTTQLADQAIDAAKERGLDPGLPDQTQAMQARLDQLGRGETPGLEL